MISIIVLTKNEEDRINVCLESVKWADELLVADSGSTDDTLKIAKKYTDKIISLNDLDFSAARNMAMEQVKGEWVLYVDADERVLQSLREEIEKIVKADEKSAYAISRKNIIFGQEVNYGPYKHDWVIRLFKRVDFEGWKGKIHESVHFKGRLGYTKNSLLHLTHRNIDQIVLKSLEWSKIDSRLRLESGHPKMSAWRFLRIFITEVFNQAILRKGFFNGTIGVMDSLLQAFSMYMTYVRLWEIQQEKPLDKIYEEIDKKLLENNFKY